MSTPRWTPFAKGHGTGNDFVILPDPHAELELHDWRVAAVCHRRTGVGGDGVLRVVPAAKDPASVAQAGQAQWFMDYRNADGSLAQMCGNGARVFAQYLVNEGLAEPGLVPIATRDGVKRVHVPTRSGDHGDPGEPGTATVELALPRLGGATTVTVGFIGTVGSASLPATAVDVGNPHAVCVTDDPAGFDFSDAPRYDQVVFTEGVNVELISTPRIVETADGQHDQHPRLQVRMRVYERGSGETLSCGTGAVAAAAVALTQFGGRDGVVTQPSPPRGTVLVDLPGGRLHIQLTDTVALLTGPTVIVAKGHCLL